MRRITKIEAATFETRWTAVEAAEVAELRATSKAQKLRQLIALMSSAEQLGWNKPLAAEESEVRKRWRLLRLAEEGKRRKRRKQV